MEEENNLKNLREEYSNRNELLKVFRHEGITPFNFASGIIEELVEVDEDVLRREPAIDGLKGCFDKIKDYLPKLNLPENPEEEKLKISYEKQNEIYWVVLPKLRKELIHALAHSKMLNQKDLDKESTGLIQNGLLQMRNFYDLFKLSNLSREEVDKNREYFSLTNILRNSAKISSPVLTGAEVGVSLNYNPFDLYLNKSTASAMVRTLFQNSAIGALKNSELKMGLKMEDKNLEYLIENSTNGKDQRNYFGLGEKVGITFAKKMVNLLGGTFENYKTPKINSQYLHRETFGFEGDFETPKEVYGVRVSLPLEDLNKTKE